MIIAAYLHGNISVSKTLPQALSTCTQVFLKTVFAVNLSLSHTQTAFQVTENRPFGKLHPGWKYLETSLSMFIDGGQQQRCLEMMMKTLIFSSYLGLISVWNITAKWVFEIVHWWNGCLSIYLKQSNRVTRTCFIEITCFENIFFYCIKHKAQCTSSGLAANFFFF